MQTRYNLKRNLKPVHREALRMVACGHSYTAIARELGISRSTIHALVRSCAGARYLEREQDRIDAHRTLLAASIPYLAMMDAARGTAVSTDPPPRPRARVRRTRGKGGAGQ